MIISSLWQELYALVFYYWEPHPLAPHSTPPPSSWHVSHFGLLLSRDKCQITWCSIFIRSTLTGRAYSIKAWRRSSHTHAQAHTHTHAEIIAETQSVKCLWSPLPHISNYPGDTHACKNTMQGCSSTVSNVYTKMNTSWEYMTHKTIVKDTEYYCEMSSKTRTNLQCAEGVIRLYSCSFWQYLCSCKYLQGCLWMDERSVSAIILN